MPDLNEDFIPASGSWRASDAFSVSFYFIIIFIFPDPAKASDRPIEVCALGRFESLTGRLLELSAS